MAIFVRAEDYDKIKKGKDVEIVIEATNREPMTVFISTTSVYTIKTDYSNYENARFNSEFD